MLKHTREELTVQIEGRLSTAWAKDEPAYLRLEEAIVPG